MSLVIPFVQYFGATAERELLSHQHLRPRSQLWTGGKMHSKANADDEIFIKSVVKLEVWEWVSQFAYLIHLFFCRFAPANILTGSVGEQGGNVWCSRCYRGDLVTVGAAVTASRLINNPLKVLFNAVLLHTLPTLFQNAPFLLLLLLLLCTFFFFLQQSDLITLYADNQKSVFFFFPQQILALQACFVFCFFWCPLIVSICFSASQTLRNAHQAFAMFLLLCRSKALSWWVSLWSALLKIIPVRSEF